MNDDDDEDQPATAETIIHALSQFGAEEVEQGVGNDASDSLHHYSTLLSDQGQLDKDNTEKHGLGGMSRQELEAEVVKLRGLVHLESKSPSLDIQVNRLERGDVPDSSAKRVKTTKGKGKAFDVDIQTGKRIEKGRKTELYKAIRQTMRFAMGMLNETDPLPAPRSSEASTTERPMWEVPDWQAAIGDEANSRWTNSIAQDLFEQLHSETNPYPKVEDLDSDMSTIQEAVKVTFANYVKRYKSENDTIYADRKARYAKNRRRWARKDLKQEKRSKARTNIDPSSSFSSLPIEALLFDYQSSEHSSSGSDSADSDAEYHTVKARRRKVEWDDVRNAEAGPSGLGHGILDGVDAIGDKGKAYGWGTGLTAKVLEVRTPSWRSEHLNGYYAHLDSLSELHAQARNTPKVQADRSRAASTKAGHVAPSHRRFTLPPDIRRKGTVPRALKSGGSKRRKGGEDVATEEATGTSDSAGREGGRDTEHGWMWATGEVGVWPTRTRVDGAEEMRGVEQSDMM